MNALSRVNGLQPVLHGKEVALGYNFVAVFEYLRLALIGKGDLGNAKLCLIAVNGCAFPVTFPELVKNFIGIFTERNRIKLGGVSAFVVFYGISLIRSSLFVVSYGVNYFFRALAVECGLKFFKIYVRVPVGVERYNVLRRPRATGKNYGAPRGNRNCGG